MSTTDPTPEPDVDSYRAARRDPDSARDTNPDVDSYRATIEKKDFK